MLLHRLSNGSCHTKWQRYESVDSFEGLSPINSDLNGSSDSIGSYTVSWRRSALYDSIITTESTYVNTCIENISSGTLTVEKCFKRRIHSNAYEDFPLCFVIFQINRLTLSGCLDQDCSPKASVLINCRFL